MTDNTNVDDANLDNDTGGGGQPTQEELNETLANAKAEAAKYKNLAKQAQKERDELKKLATQPKDPSEPDYKKLYTDINDEVGKLKETAKSEAVRAAVLAKLGKSGVISERIQTAAKLLDLKQVEYEDGEVDQVSLTAVIHALKKEEPWLFETKVKTTDGKDPVDSSADGKTITRAAFDALSPLEKMDRMQKKFVIAN